MDLDNSANKELAEGQEETVDDLIQKIKSRGAKVKILKEDEEPTPDA